VAGEVFEVYHRDIIQCIKALYGDPQFIQNMVFAPEQHFKHQGEDSVRLYHDMHTGQWWWKTQV
jgi:Plavaka transposase